MPSAELNTGAKPRSIGPEPARPYSLEGAYFSFPRPIREREKPREREVCLRELIAPEFQAALRGAFDALDNLPTNWRSRSLIQGLQDYGAKLDTHLGTSYREKPLDTKTVKRLISAGPAIASRFDRMLYRLRNESNFLDNLDEVGTLKLMFSTPRTEDVGVPVKFFPREKWIAKFGRKVAGLYFPSNESVMIRGKAPSPARMWLSIASRGELPREISVLHHELVHAAQGRFDNPGFWKIMGAAVAITASFFVPLALFGTTLGSLVTIGGCALYTMYLFYKAQAEKGKKHADPRVRDLQRGRCAKLEAQAWLSHLSLPGDRHGGGSFNFDRVKSEVINTLAHHLVYGLGSESKGLTNRALDTLWSLRLLGVGERDIAMIVARTSTDFHKGKLPQLEHRLEKELRYWGLDDATAPVVLRALAGKAELEHHVQKFKARQIAREELDRFAAEQAKTAH